MTESSWQAQPRGTETGFIPATQDSVGITASGCSGMTSALPSVCGHTMISSPQSGQIMGVAVMQQISPNLSVSRNFPFQAQPGFTDGMANPTEEAITRFTDDVDRYNATVLTLALGYITLFRR